MNEMGVGASPCFALHVVVFAKVLVVVNNPNHAVAQVRQRPRHRIVVHQSKSKTSSGLEIDMPRNGPPSTRISKGTCFSTNLGSRSTVPVSEELRLFSHPLCFPGTSLLFLFPYITTRLSYLKSWQIHLVHEGDGRWVYPAEFEQHQNFSTKGQVCPRNGHNLLQIYSRI